MAILHQDDSIHRAIQYVLHTVLDDDDGAAGSLLNLINQDDCLLAGGGIQIGKGFIKQQHVHISDHDAA